jgi:hypothetical protein
VTIVNLMREVFPHQYYLLSCKPRYPLERCYKIGSFYRVRAHFHWNLYLLTYIMAKIVNFMILRLYNTMKGLIRCLSFS